MGVPAQARAGHGSVSVSVSGSGSGPQRHAQTVVVCLLVFHCFYFPPPLSLTPVVAVVVDPQPAHGSIFNLKSTTKRETHKNAK